MEWIYAALVFVLVTGILMAPPMIGIANNGDFERIMGQPGIGLAYTTDDRHLRYANWIHRYFLVVGGGNAAYPSSLSLIVRGALLINELLYGRGLFDIAVLGILYAALLAVSGYFVLGAVRRVCSPWMTVLTAISGVVVFCDLAYIAYFHSLYSEAVSFVSFCLLAGFALTLYTLPKPRLWTLGAFILSAAAFGTAKVQTVPLAIILALFTARLAWIRRDRRWKWTALGGSVLLLLSVGYVYLHTPRHFYQVNLYHSVFDGILTNPATWEEDMKALQLDPKYRVLAGTSYFGHHPIDIHSREFAYDFYQKIGFGKVALFYVERPGRLLDVIRQSYQASLMMRPQYLGNYERTSGYPEKTLSHRFSLWSDAKSRWFPKSVWFFGLYWLLYGTICLWRRLRRKDRLGKALAEFSGLVGLLALIQFPIPYLAEGRNELVKHLFTYNVLFDMTLLISAVWLFARAESYVRANRQKRNAMLVLPGNLDHI
ncbi:MAG: hypothetical protein IRY98_07680 [Alicyclobacillaceae bacterium]|nr:hypothetical protein [Alicyclobacillaceae bacterium]